MVKENNLMEKVVSKGTKNIYSQLSQEFIASQNGGCVQPYHQVRCVEENILVLASHGKLFQGSDWGSECRKLCKQGTFDW